MGKNDRKDRSDEIRIVEDENPEEEVVRLDAPKRVVIEKKEALSEDRAMPHMMGEAEKVEEAKAKSIDPEQAWLDEAEEKDVRSVPMGWFVLLGLVLAGVLFWVVRQNMVADSSPEGVEAESTPIVEDGELPLSRIEEMEKKAKAKEHFEEMERVIAAFLGAKSVEERAKYVRDPERVLPLMEDYYSRHELQSFEYDGVEEYHVISLNNFPFLALSVGVKEGTDKPILIEDGKAGMKVDWEAVVCYQPTDVGSFIENKVTEPTDLRVYARRDLFYAFDFADEKKYACFQLSFRDSDHTIFGYVERGTPVYQEFQKMFRGGNMKQTSALILSVAFEPGSRAPRSVKIHDLVSRLWAYPPSIQKEDTKE